MITKVKTYNLIVLIIAIILFIASIYVTWDNTEFSLVKEIALRIITSFTMTFSTIIILFYFKPIRNEIEEIGDNKVFLMIFIISLMWNIFGM